MVWMWRHCRQQWTVELTDHQKFLGCMKIVIIHYFHTSKKSGFSLHRFSAAIKLVYRPKSGYPDNGYPDLQTLMTAYLCDVLACVTM